MVLSYSHALTECRTTDGGTIGLNGLLERVRQHDPSQPSELVTRLAKQLQGEHTDNLTTTDSTVLLCRASDTGVRWQDNVLAPFRLLRSVTDRTRIG